MSSKDRADEHSTTVVGGSGEGGAGDPSAPEDDRYLVREEVGRGGLGRVLRAEDRKLGRTVVLKQLLVRSPDLEERFRREALLSSRLEHPAIITVHDLVLGADQPFYTMRLVSGRTLGELIRRCRGLRDRLALLPHVVTVADAVAYAHSRGILHRDIKPANILVGEFGETVLIDWGLAKVVGEEEAPQPGTTRRDGALTQIGDVVGTPAYMPPEQALGEAVDERADIYALGSVLFEVLTGRAPHAFALGDSDLARLHAQPPPSVSAEAADTPPDLAAIVGKAMARDPRERYASAADMASDLKRFTTGQIVSVYRYSLRALLRRWLGRNRLPVAIGALALVALAVVSTIAVARIVRERDRAEDRANDLRVAQARAIEPSDPTLAMAWLASARFDERRFREAHRIGLRAAESGVAEDVLVLDRTPIRAFAVAGDGRHVVVGGEHGVVLWEIATRRPSLVPVTDGPVVAVDFRGDLVAAATGSGRVLLLDRAGHPVGPPTQHQGTPSRLAIAPDGETVVLGTRDGVIERRDRAGTVTRLHRVQGAVLSLEWSGDGRLAWGSSAGPIGLWDGQLRELGASTGLPARVAFAGPTLVAATSGRLGVLGEGGLVWNAGAPERHHPTALGVRRDGAGVLTGGSDGELYLWGLDGGAPRKLDAALADPAAFALSPDGALYAVGLIDGEVRLGALDPASGFVTERKRGHRGPIVGLGYLDDRVLVSAGREGELRLWRVDDPRRERGFVAEGAVMEVGFLPERDELVAVTRGGVVSAWKLTGAGTRRLGTVGAEAALAVSADGQWIAAAGDLSLRVWSAAGGEPRTFAGHTEAIYAVAFSPDGQWLVSTGEDERAFLWRLADGVRRELPHAGVALHAAFSPDSRLVAVGGLGGEVRVWATDGTRVRTLVGHEVAVRRLAWSRTGLLATAGMDRVARVWSPSVDDQARWTLPARQPLYDVAFSPDGSRLAACGDDGEAALWTLDRPTPTALRLAGHDGPVFDVAFSPDGTTVATAGRDGTVRLWDHRTGLARVLLHQGALKRLGFSPDGGRIAAGNDLGSIRVWPVGGRELPETPAALAAWIRRQTSVVLDEDGGARSPIRQP